MEQVLVFSLGEELFALEVTHLQEVVESPRYHPIPRSPAVFLGAINFHGTILPVLDLAASLGLAGSQRDGRVIVLSAALCPLALAVSAVRQIVPLEDDALLPAPEQGRAKGCTRATFGRDGEMINLLDVTRLLASLETVGKRTGGDHGA